MIKNYLIDRMTLASPSFALARELQSNGKIKYTIIEEVTYESRNDKNHAESIKKESVDNISTAYIESLKNFVPELIDLGVVKPNKGCGDAMLIAEYLAYGVGEQKSLFEKDETMVIVTDDKKLYKYCDSKKIANIRSKDFFELCDNVKSN